MVYKRFSTEAMCTSDLDINEIEQLTSKTKSKLANLDLAIYYTFQPYY